MSSSDYSGLATGLGLVISLVYFLVVLLVAVVTFVSLWKTFKKAGRPGWASIIPFYNNYILSDIATGNILWFILLFVPGVNIFISYYLFYKLGTSFGKSTGFCIGLIFLPVVFLPILAFGDSTYIGAN